MRNIVLMISFLLPVFISSGQPVAFQKKFTLLDRYIDSLMKDWNIPGLALGIVYKDQLIYAKGYGLRDIENKLPVESSTIFPIASNTKLFTATAAGMYAEEGKLNLDKPVRNYMPSLNFNNDELDARVTLRDMLSHRTGLPRYDGIWLASPFTRTEMVGKIAEMEPSLGFREGYIYNNVMYAAAGAVMENISGMRWEDIIRQKFFVPLQMNASGFTNQEMSKPGNYAKAYFEPDSTRRLQQFTYLAQSNALGPAGTIQSSVNDMSHWMIAQLNEGKYKGQQVIPEAVIKQTLIPNTIADKEGKWSELSNGLYGLGRLIQTYKGYKITTHTGSIDGYYSNLTFIPSENLGIFMVHNSSAAEFLRSVMAFPLMDRLLNLTITPWSERYKKDYNIYKADEKRRKETLLATQVSNTVPSHPLVAYCGKYVNSMYGPMEIEWQNDSLLLLFRGQKALLHHFHYDQFATNELDSGQPGYRIYFSTNNLGEIDRCTLDVFGSGAAFIKNNK